MIDIYNNSGAIIVSGLLVGDGSYRYREIMNKSEVRLEFSLPEYKEIPVGSYIDYEGVRYTLMNPSDVTVGHSREYDYVAVFSDDAARLTNYVIVHPVDGRVKFDYTARISEHLALIVANLNDRAMGVTWGVGTISGQVDDREVLITYDAMKVSDALNGIAEETESEWEIVVDAQTGTRLINIGKIERNAGNPIALAYGKEGGLDSGLGRSAGSDGSPITKVYVQGGDRNIVLSDYGSSTLHLPKRASLMFDGEHFEDEDGYEATDVITVKTDLKGLAASVDTVSQFVTETAEEFSEIYPKRVGVVSKVAEVGSGEGNVPFIDIWDNSIGTGVGQDDIVFKAAPGEQLTIIFQSRSLTGREIGVSEFRVDADGGHFKLCQESIDGTIMPSAIGGAFCPAVGDEYAVFGCVIPDAYIAKAERELLRQAAKVLYDNRSQRFSVKATINREWAVRNWDSVKDRLVLGGRIVFRSEELFSDSGYEFVARIKAIKDSVNVPQEIDITFDNETVRSGLSSTITALKANRVHGEEVAKEGKRYSDRRWRDAKETAQMLVDAGLTAFSEAINPITVNTMQLIAGDESLQFIFGKITSDSKVVADDGFYVNYDTDTKVLSIGTTSNESGNPLLYHYTIETRSIGWEDTKRRWNIAKYVSDPMTNAYGKYYIYARCPKVGDGLGAFVMSETAIGLEQEEGYYHFLVGILNAEYEGSRSFVSLYGYTEILPGRLTVGNVMSKDGRCWFDLDTGHFHIGNADGDEYVTFDDNGVQISGKVTIGNGSTGVSNFGDFAEGVTEKIKAIDLGVQNLLRNSGFTGDYLSEELADQIVLEETKTMYNSPLVHWESSGANGVENASYLSGHACEISAGGFISQTLQVALRAGNAYSIKFSATGSGTLVIRTLSFPFEGSFETTFRPAEDVTVLKITATGSLTIGDIMLVPGEVSVEWSRSPLDNQADRVYYQSLKYLADAIGRGDTVINGGLILSNIIALGNYDGSGTINSGISGIKNVDSDVAFWGGGTYDQAQATALKFIYKPSSEVVSDDAKAVITHGGTAVLNDVIVHGKVYASEGEFSGTVTSTKGNIGGFEIGDGWLQSKELGPDGLSLLLGLKLSSTTLSFPGRTTTDEAYFNSLIISTTGGASSGKSYKMYDARIEYSGKSNEQVSTGISIDVTGGTSTNKAISVSASGNADAAKNIALELVKGCVAGFRPKTVFPSISPYYCDSLDNVVIMTSGQVYLPSPVEHGHILLIWHISASNKLTILSRLEGEIIVTMNGRSGTSIDSTNQECILLTYAFDGENYRWYLAYFG